jgi:hypothetical protein
VYKAPQAPQCSSCTRDDEELVFFIDAADDDVFAKGVANADPDADADADIDVDVGTVGRSGPVHPCNWHL